MTTGKTIALTIWFENSMNSMKRPHIGGLQWLMTMTFMFTDMAGNIHFSLIINNDSSKYRVGRIFVFYKRELSDRT